MFQNVDNEKKETIWGRGGGEDVILLQGQGQKNHQKVLGTKKKKKQTFVQTKYKKTHKKILKLDQLPLLYRVRLF